VLPIIQLHANLIRARCIRESLRVSSAIDLMNVRCLTRHRPGRLVGTIRVLLLIAPGSPRLIAVVSASRESDTSFSLLPEALMARPDVTQWR
jgi:hypothetical protein